MLPQLEIVDRLKKKIEAESERAKELMASGNLNSFDEYRFSCGYRKALADCLILLNETHEEVMKE